MITSNVSEVIRRLKSGRDRAIAGLTRLGDPNYKSPVDVEAPASALLTVAKSILADPMFGIDEESAARILSTYETHGGEGMEFALRGIAVESLPLIPTQVPIAHPVILEWVERGFRKEIPGKQLKASRDQDANGQWKSPEDIAKNVAAAIRARPEDWFHPGMSPGGLVAFAALVQVPTAKLNLALRAILTTWVLYMKERQVTAAAHVLRSAFKA